MLPSSHYEMRTAALQPRDLLCLYTNGVTESMNRSREQFGEERLLKILKKNAGLPACDIIGKIYEAVFGFTESNQLEDDITLVILRWK